MKTPANLYTDHVNRNKLDNRKVNLRWVTASENAKNVGVHKDTKSGVKGVSYKKGRKSCWQARVDKKTLGYFKTIEEAENCIKQHI